MKTCNIIKPTTNNNIFCKFLTDSLVKNKSLTHSNYFQLSSVNIKDSSLFPSVRTVSFKGFFNDMLKITTDISSTKIKEITDNCLTQICWYFPITREQYRINCIAYLISSKGIINQNSIIKYEDNLDELQHNEDEYLEAREDMWNNMSESAKSMFNHKNDYILVLLKVISCDHYNTNDNKHVKL